MQKRLTKHYQRMVWILHWVEVHAYILTIYVYCIYLIYLSIVINVVLSQVVVIRINRWNENVYRGGG